MSSNDRNSLACLMGAGLGFMAGCALGILYAPEAGKRTRRQISDAVEDGAEELSSRARETTESIRKSTQKLHDDTKDLLDRGQAAFEKGKDAIEKGVKAYQTAAR